MEKVTYRDLWLLAQKCFITYDGKTRNYFQDVSNVSVKYGEFRYNQLLMWPPKTYYQYAPNRDWVTDFDILEFDESTQRYKVRFIENITAKQLTDKGYVMIAHPQEKRFYYFLEPDVEYIFLNTPSSDKHDSSYIIDEIMTKVKFPFMSNEYDPKVWALAQTAVGLSQPLGPPKEQIRDLNSIAFYTMIYATLMPRLVIGKAIILEFDLQRGLDLTKYTDNNPNLIVYTRDQSSEIVELSVFNLIVYIDPSWMDELIEYYRSFYMVEVSENVEENDERLIELVTSS